MASGGKVRGMWAIFLLLLLSSSCLCGDSELKQAVNQFEGKDYKQETETGTHQAQIQDKSNPITNDDSKSINKDLTEGAGGAGTTLKFGFVHAFLASLSVIIVSEIGDKTFFIAAILAMANSRLLVFAGALSALGFMTFLSVCLGYATIIIPRWVTFYVCTLLLVVFGLKMLYDGWNMNPDEGQEEFEEVSAELKRKDEAQAVPGDVEQGGSITTSPPLHRRFYCLACLAPIFVKSFTLTFLAEWGDRSQLTTIVLSAREDPVGVTLGGTLGHALCTALAVLGGKIIAQRISVRTVTLIGGVVFLLFALTALFHNPDSDSGV